MVEFWVIADGQLLFQVLNLHADGYLGKIENIRDSAKVA